MKVGDTVIHIGDSFETPMTVEKIILNKQRVYVVWFNSDNELKRDWFTFEELENVSLDFA